MRSLSGAALVLAAVLVAAPVSAQTSLSFALGANVPVGSTADDLEVGWNAAIGLGIKPPLAPIGLRLEGLFSEMNSKIYNSGKDRVVAGIANVTISGAGMPMPMGYLIGGLGMYNVAGSDYPALTGRNASETNLGVNVGAGLNFPLTGFSTFLEARFHYVTDDRKTKFIPITFGIRF